MYFFKNNYRKYVFIVIILISVQSSVFPQAQEILRQEIIGDWSALCVIKEGEGITYIRRNFEPSKEQGVDKGSNKTSFFENNKFSLYNPIIYCRTLPTCGSECTYDPKSTIIHEGTWSINGSNRYYTLTMIESETKREYKITHFSNDKIVLEPIIEELVHAED